jgi:hypothetical protein
MYEGERGWVAIHVASLKYLSLPEVAAIVGEYSRTRGRGGKYCGQLYRGGNRRHVDLYDQSLISSRISTLK